MNASERYESWQTDTSLVPNILQCLQLDAVPEADKQALLDFVEKVQDNYEGNEWVRAEWAGTHFLVTLHEDLILSIKHGFWLPIFQTKHQTPDDRVLAWMAAYRDFH